MPSYQLLNPKGVRNLETGVDVMPDQSSASWQAYRAWTKTGGVALPADPPTPKPEPLPDPRPAYVEMIRRRANKLAANGQQLDALLLLKTIGE